MSGTIDYTVAPNPGAERTGHIDVLGPDGTAQLTVTQSPCTYSLKPATQTVASKGGSFSTVLTTSCSWKTSSDFPWITGVTASGTTSGTINYTVGFNSGAERPGHIDVLGPGGSTQLTIVQSAGQPVLLETISVPSNGNAVRSKVVLEKGVTYQIRASGTIIIDCCKAQGDAEWVLYPTGNIGGTCAMKPDTDLGIGINDTSRGEIKSPNWEEYKLQARVYDQFHRGRVTHNAGLSRLRVFGQFRFPEGRNYWPSSLVRL